MVVALHVEADQVGLTVGSVSQSSPSEIARRRIYVIQDNISI